MEPTEALGEEDKHVRTTHTHTCVSCLVKNREIYFNAPTPCSKQRQHITGVTLIQQFLFFL